MYFLSYSMVYTLLLPLFILLLRLSWICPVGAFLWLLCLFWYTHNFFWSIFSFCTAKYSKFNLHLFYLSPFSKVHIVGNAVCFWVTYLYVEIIASFLIRTSYETLYLRLTLIVGLWSNYIRLAIIFTLKQFFYFLFQINKFWFDLNCDKMK